MDFNQIKRLHHAKRALEVAAAGRHHVMLVGPAGGGKSMLATAFGSIQPDSFAGVYAYDPPTTKDLIGLINLAEQSYLIVDHPAHWQHSIRKMLANALDTAWIRYEPVGIHVIATSRPCFCGNYMNPDQPCTCDSVVIARFARRLDALLEHIPMVVTIPAARYEEITSQRGEEPSAAVRERVARAQDIQMRRGAIVREYQTDWLQEYCQLDGAGQSLLKAAVRQLGYSQRRVTQLRLVARTIADLAESAHIGAAHLVEAIQYLPRRTEVETHA